MATVVVLLLGVGLRYPWPADEPRFAQIAREMVESGQWLFPTRGGEFYPDKPPVFMWISAAFFALIGHLKVSFLLPSAVAAIGTLLLVHDLGKRLWNPQVAFWAVLVLAFTPQFLLQGKAAQIDALVTFWITLGCYGLVRHFITGPHWRWYFVSWVAMGLGIMTKGVGFLPLLMLLPLALWVKNPLGASTVDKVWRWRAAAGLLVLLLTVACWLGPMLWQVHVQGTDDLLAYRNNILFRQTAERYANAWGHIKPWHYFLTQAMPLVWFPLPFVLLALIKPLVALAAHRRQAACAAGVGGAGGGVFLHQQGQARGLHLPRAAHAGAGGGGVVEQRARVPPGAGAGGGAALGAGAGRGGHWRAGRRDPVGAPQALGAVAGIRRSAGHPGPAAGGAGRGVAGVAGGLAPARPVCAHGGQQPGDLGVCVADRLAPGGPAPHATADHGGRGRAPASRVPSWVCCSSRSSFCCSASAS